MADLGGLGSKEGPEVSYIWAAPSLLPLALPWLGTLLLLALVPNRTGRAWWIWVPLGSVVALVKLARPAFAFLPEEAMDVFVQVVNALAFGFSATWLLAPYLATRHRFVTFLCLLLAPAAFGELTILVTQDWGAADPASIFATAFLLALSALVLASARMLAGLACRKRFRPAGLGVWLLVWLLVLSFAVSAPFFMFTIMASGGRVDLQDFLLSVLVSALVAFAVVLPFLVLSTANSLYRERIKGLLHLERAAPPPVIAPPPIPPAAAPM